MNYKNRKERNLGNNVILATFRRRLAAFLIDFLMIVLLYFIVFFILGLFNVGDLNLEVKGIFDVELETVNHSKFLTLVLKICFGLLPVFYFTLFMYFTSGRTIGKYFLGIRVISLFHEKLGLWHCFERSLGYFTSALESGFGFIQARWNPNRMALHDKIGETIVIVQPTRAVFHHKKS
ncbi:MAG: RDD family protein [Bacteroidales bacterium]